jgi:hypothetical protein
MLLCEILVNPTTSVPDAGGGALLNLFGICENIFIFELCAYSSGAGQFRVSRGAPPLALGELGSAWNAILIPNP